VPFTHVEGTTYVARIDMEIPEAHATRVRVLARPHSPRPLELRVSQPSGSADLEVYDLAGLDDPEVWTGSVYGPDVRLEFVSNAGDPSGVTFVSIDQAVVEFREAAGPAVDLLTANAHLEGPGEPTPGWAADCLVNATCVLPGSGLVASAAAVAHIRFVKDGRYGMCSGTLLNDLDPTRQLRYFLTARHCIPDQATASTIEFYWNYRETSCYRTGPATWLRTSGGADLLATSFVNDTTLLRLRPGALPGNGVTFAGWTTVLPDPNVYDPRMGPWFAGLGLSHPWGDALMFSEGIACQFKEPFWKVAPTPMIAVTWRRGGIQKGSSGSALFKMDADGPFVVGVCSRAHDVPAQFCRAFKDGTLALVPEGTEYGSLSYSYHLGGFKPWLDYVSPPVVDDHGDLPHLGTELTPNGASANGHIGEPLWSPARPDHDCFRIAVPGRGILTVAPAGTTELKAILYSTDVYSGEEQQAPFRSDSIPNPGFLDGLGLRREYSVYCDRAGVAYLDLYGWYPETRGSYVVTATFDPVPADDAGNSAAESRPVTPQGTLRGSLASSTWMRGAGGEFDQDWHRIIVTADSRLSAFIASGSFPTAEMSLYDVDLREVSDGLGPAKDRFWVENAPLPPGEYYIRVRTPYFEGATSYSITFYFTGDAIDYRGDFTGDGAVGSADYQAVAGAWRESAGVVDRFTQLFDVTADGWLDGWDLLGAYGNAVDDPASEVQNGMVDVDADGSVSMLGDGVLLARHEAGLRDEALTAGVLGPAAARTTADELSRFMQHTRPLYDIDGDLWLMSPTDRMLLFRYLLGFRGESLTLGLEIDPSAERTTADAIEAYLRALTPPRPL